MITIDNLSYDYNSNNKMVLKNLNLKIQENEFIAVVGKNGSGKSTLARLLNGTLIPRTGNIIVDGLNTRSKTDIRSIKTLVGLLLPTPDNQLISNIVEEDVAFGPENLGLPPGEIRYRVDRSLKMVAMNDYAKHSPHLLSGGQKQRVTLAGLLAMKPKYMVLDEPTSMLDPQGRQEVMETILGLRASEGITLILITHHLEEVVYADRIVILDEGELIAEGSPGELLQQSEMLESIGLETLEITKIINLLNSKNYKLPQNILQIDRLVNELCLYK